MKNETERLERAILKIGGPEIAATILEAAGKVHKDVCLREIKTSTLVNSFETLTESSGDTITKFNIFPREEIRSLLEALPDRTEDTFAYQSVFGSKPEKEE
jgi:hypothetical protein